NKKTGELAWQQPRESYRACYTAPMLLERSGSPTELIVGSSTAITGYDPDNGTKLWEWKWKFLSKRPLRTIAAPIYHNGMMFAFSGDGGGDRHMVALKLSGAGTSTKVETVWENRKDFPYVPNPLVRGDHIYFAQ